VWLNIYKTSLMEEMEVERAKKSRLVNYLEEKYRQH
jgi:hypothetical protein